MSTQLELDELRKRLIRKNNELKWFGSLSGVVITEIGDGCCRAYVDITEDSFGPNGQVCNGVLCTLMDDLAAMASAGTGRGSVTINGKNDYFKPITQPCRLEGYSQLEGQEGPICTYHTAVYLGEDLVASGTYTFYLKEDLTHR